MARCSLSVLALALVFASVQCQRGSRNPDRAERDQTDEACQEKVMDIFFVLDSSSSIYYKHYDNQLQFVRDVVSRLDVSPIATRVGILTFSDDITRPPVELNQYTSKGDVLNAVTLQTLPYRTGYTNTHTAIRYVRESPEFRQDITKVMVVVTDGGSRVPGSTIQEARLAREQGFYMMVVGVGQYLDEAEWRGIASDPDSSFIFNITDFRLLDSVKFSLPPRACALPPIIIGGSCGVQQPADLFFVAAPGGTQEAVQLIDHFTERTTDDDDLLQVSYFMDICDGGENVALGNLDRYCNRELDPPEANDNTNGRLLERVRNVAQDNRNQRRGVPQVVVLFLNTAMIARESRSYTMYNLAQTLREDGLEVVVVDLGIPGNRRRLANRLAANSGNLVRFTQGSIVSQVDAQTSFMDVTCEALSRRQRSTRPPRRTRRPGIIV